MRLTPALPCSSVALLSACLALAGCAHRMPEPPEANPAVAATWSETGSTRDTAALARWWQLFQDPLLTQLVDEALRANTDIRSSQATLAQARALRDVSAAGRQPQVDTSANAGRSRSGGNTGNSLQAGLDASWELDLFGASAAALRGSQADVRTAQADLAAVQVAIAGEVGQAYVQLRGYRLQRSLAQSSLASQLETLQITAWRAQAGLASSLDAEQARATAEQTRASLPGYDSTIAQTEHRLALLLGLAPKALAPRLRWDEANPALPMVSQPQLPLGLPAETLRARPDVQAAEYAIQAEAARLAQRRAQALPSFAISGSLAVQAATVAALSSGAAVITSAVAAVSWPLWDGGANRAQQAAQQAVLDRARISYEATVLAALQDVENALAAYHASQAQRLSLEQADQAAQNALLLARQRYQAGLVDFTTLLDAQRSALSIATSLATARTNESLNLVLLYKGLGGGWDAAASTPSARTTPLRSTLA